MCKLLVNIHLYPRYQAEKKPILAFQRCDKAMEVFCRSLRRPILLLLVQVISFRKKPFRINKK